jgi:hypothetical protein
MEFGTTFLRRSFMEFGTTFLRPLSMRYAHGNVSPPVATRDPVRN